MIISYDLPVRYEELGLKIDGVYYKAFDEGGFPAWHDVELAEKHPNDFEKYKTINKDHYVAVLRIAKSLCERHKEYYEEVSQHKIEQDLRAGGVRKAFMVWATGRLDTKVPRLPRLWDYKLTLPKLVKRG